METKQDSKQEPSFFVLIVDKLSYINEAALKLAYIKLFRKELEEEWINITAVSDFSSYPERQHE